MVIAGCASTVTAAAPRVILSGSSKHRQQQTPSVSRVVGLKPLTPSSKSFFSSNRFALRGFHSGMPHGKVPIHRIPSPTSHEWHLHAMENGSSGAVPNDALAAVSQPPSAAKDADMKKTLYLGLLFGLWYLFNIYFNIYNKQVLKVFPYPITCTALQFAVGSLLVVVTWLAGLHKKPQTNRAQVTSVAPLAVVHTLGNLLTNVSLGLVAVSFTHTIKAMEPFFSVLLSALFLGMRPQLTVVASLVPVVAGVALASVTEASFNWAGFLSAMGSNVTFQSRNVLSKKLMAAKVTDVAPLDNINLFSIITIISFFLLAPVAIIAEGWQLSPAVFAARGLDAGVVMTQALLAAVCFHAYQQVSYMILAKVSPVTHSVGNCVKRVVVIVSSILFFRTPVEPLNAVGG
eukprot:jgi/Mesvir1/17381/Mv08683-RA.2